MIKRKMGVEQKPEKERKKRAKKIKVDMSKLPDAVVDGKLVVPVGGKVFFERRLDGRAAAIHEGFIKHVFDDGSVEIWDETREQLFCFNVRQAIPTVKVG
jgi:hypothetical protein